MTPISDHLSFVRTFREETHSAVEYSFGPERDTYGTMIAGVGPRFVERAKQFANNLPYATEFVEVIGRFGSHLATDAYLFKADWRKETAERLSLYYRFIHGVPQNDLERAFEHARPLCWEGPSPHRIGDSIQAGSPVIVGVRVNKNGLFQSSVYYNYVEAGHGGFVRRVLQPLVQLLTWTPDLSRAIGQDVTPLLPHSAHAAIGVDSASGATPVVLKVAAADVSWNQAATSLSRKGVPQFRLIELAAFARQLRQARLNYAGMKFGPSGFLGWKLYWAKLGWQQSSASATRIVLS